MNPPRIIKNSSNGKSCRIENLIQSFDATVNITRKVWIAFDDKNMKKELAKDSCYDDPESLFNDMVVDYGHEDIKGFKIDIGDCCSEQETNIQYGNCSHEVGYDLHSKIHLCKGKQYFYLQGTDIPELKNVDLVKFYERAQIEEVSQENIDKPRLPTKFWFDYRREVDSTLLINWIKHQLMLTMFNCTYDPFYIEGEQIQQENSGYSPNEPTYNIPEGFYVNIPKIIIDENNFNLLE